MKKSHKAKRWRKHQWNTIQKTSDFSNYFNFWLKPSIKLKYSLNEAKITPKSYLYHSKTSIFHLFFWVFKIFGILPNNESTKKSQILALYLTGRHYIQIVRHFPDKVVWYHTPQQRGLMRANTTKVDQIRYFVIALIHNTDKENILIKN